MIPDEMKKRRQWIKLPPGQKFTKEPKWQEHPLAWHDIDEPNGRGFLLQGTPYLCIDGDHVLKDGEYVTPWAESFFKELLKTGTFAEESFSGTGVHVFFKLEPGQEYPGCLDRLKGMSAKGGAYYNYYLPGFEELPKTDRPHVEIFYNAGQQICLTGKALAGDTIQHAPAKVNELLEKMAAFTAPSRQEVARQELPPDYDLQRAAAMLDHIDPAGVDYHDWVKVGALLKDLGADVSLWDAWSQKDPARYKGAREIMSKWASFKKGSGATIASLHAMAKAGGYIERDFARDWFKEHPVDPETDFFDLPEEEAPTIREALPMNPWADSLAGFVEAVESGVYDPIPTGIDVLDEILGGGPMRQQVIGIGAPPAMGKTAFCQQIAESMAMQGHDCMYFCLEMSRPQLLARGVSRIWHEETGGELSQLDIMRGHDGWRDAFALYQKTTGGRVAYMTPGYGMNSRDLGDVKRVIMDGVKWTTSQGKPAPVIIVDYLQLLNDGQKDEMESIKESMNALKGYAVKFNAIVFAIMANNRTSNKNKGEVIMEAGRGSSNLEYGCDVLLCMTFTDALAGFKGADIDKKRRSVVLTKGRFVNDTNGQANFMFQGAYSLFEPLQDMGRPHTAKEIKELESLLSM